MISRKTALEIVQQAVGRTCSVCEEQTIEREWGWVFFYASAEDAAGDDAHAKFLFGASPVFVNRRSGATWTPGTGKPPEAYIRQYERKLKREAARRACLDAVCSLFGGRGGSSDD